MVVVQKWPYFQFFFFLGDIHQENVFYDILERKNDFLVCKSKKFNKSKNWLFSKGVNPWFWSKYGHLSKCLFLGNLGQEMSFTIFWNAKRPVLAIKTRSSKSLKIDIFPKGLTHGCGSKMGIFPSVFSGNIGQENVFYDILERKNVFLSYKNKKFKKLKIWHFSKGVNPWFWSENGHFSKCFFLTQYRPGKCLLLCSRTKKRLFRL